MSQAIARHDAGAIQGNRGSHGAFFFLAMDLVKQDRKIWHQDAAAMQHIAAPRKTEGIAQALRNAYLPRVAELPANMAALLAKLR